MMWPHLCSALQCQCWPSSFVSSYDSVVCDLYALVLGCDGVRMAPSDVSGGFFCPL
jgi:hypothetical protein